MGLHVNQRDPPARTRNVAGFSRMPTMSKVLRRSRTLLSSRCGMMGKVENLPRYQELNDTDWLGLQDINENDSWVITRPEQLQSIRHIERCGRLQFQPVFNSRFVRPNPTWTSTMEPARQENLDIPLPTAICCWLHFGGRKWRRGEDQRNLQRARPAGPGSFSEKLIFVKDSEI